MEQHTQEWFDFRKNHIGSSDISVIIGSNPYKNIQTLWEEKTGRRKPESMNNAMKHGIETEPEARDFFIEHSGILFVPNIFVSDKWEIAASSLDGISSDGTKILEIKCPISEKLVESVQAGKIPSYYLDQVQWQLLCAPNATECNFFVYINRDLFATTTIFPDLKHQQKLLNEAKKFWEYVISDTEPPKKGTWIDDDISNSLASDLRAWKEKKAEAERQCELLEYSLKEMYSSDKAYVFPKAGLRLSWIEKKGTIDYKKCCEDLNVTDKTLETYRKKPSIYGTFNLVD